LLKKVWRESPEELVSKMLYIPGLLIYRPIEDS